MIRARRRAKHRAPGRPTLGGKAKNGQARHSAVGCKKGAHTYNGEQPIGGGILRRICVECGTVSIDLTEANLPLESVPSLDRPEWVLQDVDLRGWLTS